MERQRKTVILERIALSLERPSLLGLWAASEAIRAIGISRRADQEGRPCSMTHWLSEDGKICFSQDRF